ncbi:MAG: chemotaxis protein CheA [Gemmatimonadaceae bacterium]|nr:chemotaxis protein CheA [Gemmatimonadaceae bacterium]
MDDLLTDFLTESAENLSRLDSEIVGLERRPSDLALLNSIFRTIHTIKGTCGFLGLSRLESVAHAAENVLDALRSNEIVVTTHVVEVVLAAVDCIKAVLCHLEKTEAEPQGDDSALIAQLGRCLTGTPDPDCDAPAADIASPAATDIARGTIAGSTSASLLDEKAAMTTAAGPAANGGIDKAGESCISLAHSTLRVGVDLLDQMMNLVGELALSRNHLLQLVANNDDSEFAKPVQHLNRVTTDLLEAVMKTRMQPIGNAWTRLPRVVRDLAHARGKQIALDMRGADTELDRQILQAIQDPLTHMIRNSADHGVELPAVRRAAGKQEGGTITLSARHEGGHVVIEISDDGAGINVERVRRKAVERGMLKSDAADALPDAQVLRLIFEPGLSTAEQVTNVSGRGVGMDVVRCNIDKIGGTVELSSTEGRGTTVRVRIPLTLAISSALTRSASAVRPDHCAGCGDERRVGHARCGRGCRTRCDDHSLA